MTEQADEGLCGLSAIELRRLVGTKEVSPTEILDACLARIERANPAINAIVALDTERARTAARDAERAVLRGEPLGPLHGLPVAIKDTSETAGLTTTFGSPIFASHVPAADERVVAAVRRAGGIVIGKTNVPEFATGAHTTNPVYCTTGNPFDTNRTVGGSSGGAAAALATGMAPLATGSDHGGSLRTPAAFCGVVGFRPSPGVIPSDKRRLGYSPLGVDGPMARTVGDAALLLSAMAGDDPADPLSRNGSRDGFNPLPPVDLAGLRVAVSETLGFAPVETGILNTFRSRMGAIADLFGSSVEREPDLGDADHTYRVLRAHDFLAAHLTNWRERPDRLGPHIRANMEQAETFTLADHALADLERTKLYRRFQKLFEEVDVLICPATAITPFTVDRPFADSIDGKPLAFYLDWLAISYGLTLTGHPVVALPLGLDHRGMPFGIQICGPRHGDRFVLAVAAALEQVCQRRPELARPVPTLPPA